MSNYYELLDIWRSCQSWHSVYAICCRMFR